MECQQHAGNIEDCGDEERIGEFADEKVSAADLEIVLQFTTMRQKLASRLRYRLPMIPAKIAGP